MQGVIHVSNKIYNHISPLHVSNKIHNLQKKRSPAATEHIKYQLVADNYCITFQEGQMSIFEDSLIVSTYWFAACIHTCY